MTLVQHDHAPAAEIDRVTYRYRSSAGGRAALEDVSVRIEQDDFLGVIGPNGGGKTTLLRLMLGLLKPTSGTVHVFGRPPAEVRERVGYVPQHAAVDATAPATVRDIVLTGRLARSSWGFRFRRADVEAAMHALEQTGTADLAARSIGALSGGQRQRVLIARALAGDAGILLLDEPTAGVDAHMERGLTDLLHRLNERLPIVLVSHDVAFVSAHLKRVACLNRRITVHDAKDVSDEIIGRMYDEAVRAVHHEHSCPLADPGCEHGCAPAEDWTNAGRAAGPDRA
jgi:zinc transport system ATP-binding protein